MLVQFGARLRSVLGNLSAALPPTNMRPSPAAILALEPEMGATGEWRVRGGNLQNLLGDNRYPITSLSMLGTVDMSAATIESLRGSLRATVDQFSRVADARLFGGTAVVFFTPRMTMRLSMFDTRPSDRILSRRKSSKACMSRVTMRSS